VGTNRVVADRAAGQHVRRDQLNGWVAEHPWLGPLGVQFDLYEPDHVVLRWPFRADTTNDGAYFHGGIIAAAIDTAGAGAALSAFEADRPIRPTTVSMSIQYVGAAKRSDLLCEARTVKRGRELVFTEITVRDTGGKVCAHAVQTYRIVMETETE
jgi:uncharacterized protein (TIGR00369 family)